MKLLRKLLSRDLIVTEYEIPVQNPSGRPKRPVSIALLADLHDHQIGRGNEALLRAIEERSPDLIVCAGDMITAKAGFGHIRHGLALLRRLCEKYPVYLSDGNHESRLRMFPESYPGMYREYAGSLSQMGAVLLNNTSRIVKTAGMRICISGYVQPLRKYNRLHPGKVSAEEIAGAIGQAGEHDQNAFRLLIAHMPDHFDAYAAWGADLTVSGHLHGGIVRLPGIGGLFGGTFRPFPKYDMGLFEKTGESGRTSRMIVSAGLGSHSVAVRINNPPELVVIRLI